MALDLNTKYYKEFIDPSTGHTMKLSITPGGVDYILTSTEIELPSNVIINEVEVISGYPDALPIGRQLTNELTISIDLNGLYDRGTNNWSIIFDTIIRGQSEATVNTGTISNIIGQGDIYLPNIWTLEDVSASKIIFIGTQEETETTTYTYNNTEPLEITALGIEAWIYGFIRDYVLESQATKLEVGSFSVTTSFQNTIIRYNEYITNNNVHIFASWYSRNSSENNQEGDSLDLFPWYASVDTINEFLFTFIAQDVISPLLRNSGASIAVSNTYLVSHQLYKQTLTDNYSRGTELNIETDVCHMNHLEHKYTSGGIIAIDNPQSGLFYDDQLGWTANPNVWDLAISLCEQGVCRLTADYNNGSYDLTMKFEKPYQSSSGTISNVETKNLSFEKKYGYTENPTVTRNQTTEGDIVEFTQPYTDTENSDSYDIKIYYDLSPSIMKFQWDDPRNNMLQGQDIPTIRGLYYKDSIVMRMVHTQIKIDIGDGVISERPIGNFENLLPRGNNILPNLKNKYNYNRVGLGSKYTYDTYIDVYKKILGNKLQGLITAIIPTAIITNLDVGKSYTFDTDMIIDGLDNTLSQKCVLTNIKTNHIEGTAECSFFLRGDENAF